MFLNDLSKTDCNVHCMSNRTLKSLDVCENNIGAWVDLETIEALQEAPLEEFVVEGTECSFNVCTDVY